MPEDEKTSPGFRLHTHLSKHAIKRSFTDGAQRGKDSPSMNEAELQDEADHYAVAMLRSMNREELLAHKEALEQELISVARRLNGLEG